MSKKHTNKFFLEKWEKKQWCSSKSVIFALSKLKENVHALKNTLLGSTKILKMYHI